MPSGRPRRQPRSGVWGKALWPARTAQLCTGKASGRAARCEADRHGRGPLTANEKRHPSFRTWMSFFHAIRRPAPLFTALRADMTRALLFLPRSCAFFQAARRCLALCKLFEKSLIKNFSSAPLLSLQNKGAALWQRPHPMG